MLIEMNQKIKIKWIYMVQKIKLNHKMNENFVFYYYYFLYLLNQTLMNDLKSKLFPLYVYGTINDVSDTFT